MGETMNGVKAQRRKGVMAKVGFVCFAVNGFKKYYQYLSIL